MICLFTTRKKKTIKLFKLYKNFHIDNGFVLSIFLQLLTSFCADGLCFVCLQQERKEPSNYG